MHAKAAGDTAASAALPATAAASAASRQTTTRAPAACPQLTSLELSFNQLSSAAVHMLAELLRGSGRHLRTLNLAYNQIGQGHALSARRRHRNGSDSAGRGELQGSSGTALGCTDCDESTGLLHLSIAGNELCAVSLGMCLTNLCPAAAGLELDCSNCGLSGADLAILLTLELSALHLDDNVLGDSGVAQIARVIAAGPRGAWSALRMLSLCNTSTGDAGGMHLVEALRRSEASARADAASPVRATRHLRTLDLRYNRKLSEPTCGALRAVAKELVPLEMRMTQT